MEPPIKVLVVGDGSVGKTSWLSVLLNNSFSNDYNPTQGVEVHSYTSNYLDSIFQYSLWDCSGHPNHLGLFDGYYIGAQAAIIFYDCTSYHTKSAASFYKRNINRALFNITIIIVQNKTDLIENLPEISEPAISVSAKRKINILEPIKKLDEYFANKKIIQNWDDANKF